MRRFWMPIVLVVVVLILLGGGTAWYTLRHDTVKGNEAIAEVARRLDVPLDGEGPNTYRDLTLPDNFQEVDFYSFVRAWELTIGRNWNRVLQKQQLDVGWPGDVRLLTRARGDTPEAGETKCPQYNQGATRVAPDTLEVFYCAKDTMRVPGMVAYPQGTLWVPVGALVATWRQAHFVGPTLATRGQQVAQAAFVYLTANWADGLTRQIHAYADARWGIRLPRLERVNPALQFGYCVAGAMGRAVFGGDERSVVASAFLITYGQEEQMPMKVNAAALKDGFRGNTLGTCIRSHWGTMEYPD